jgi:hypothetical protein
LTWKRRVTPAKQFYYQLAVSELRTAGTGSGLLPTPAAGNPNDGEGLDSWQARRERVKLAKSNGNGFGMPLAIAVRLQNPATSGSLSPRFVAQMMGYPPDWCELAPAPGSSKPTAIR